MKGIFATEALDGFPDSLNLVQQLKAEKEGAATSEYDELHDDIKEEVVEREAADQNPQPASDDAPADTPPSEDPTPGDEPTEDTPDDTPTEEVDENGDVAEGQTVAEEPLKENNGKLEGVVAESMRNNYEDHVMAMEAISMEDVTGGLASAGQYLGQKAYDAASYGVRMVYDLLRYLVALGVSNAPAALRGVKKGVLYLFSRTLRAFFTMLTKIADFVKRQRMAITRSQKDIAELRKALQELTTASHGTELVLKQQATNSENIVKWLTPDAKGRPVASVSIVSKFMDDVLKHVDGSISHDVDIVKRLIELSSTGVRGDMTKFLSVSPLSGEFFKGSVKGYVSDSEITDTFIYRQSLPNNVLFVANLPKQSLKELSDISAGYAASGMFLAVDPRTQQLSSVVNYMDARKLDAFLAELQGLAAVALNHSAMYDHISKQCETLKFGYRHFYQKLIATPAQATVQNTLIDYVHLKQDFVNKVYLPASMDIHDYVSTFLVYAVRFAKANVKALKP